MWGPRAVLLSSLLWIWPADALAQVEAPPTQSTPAVRAIAAGQHGVRAYEQGQWSDALQYFREADTLYHSPVFSLFIGRCQRRLGQLLEARATLNQLSNELIAATAPEPWVKAQSDARAELTGLAGEVATVTLTVIGGPPAARVTSRDVLDINPANTAATIVADLGERDSLPAERFDCVIFTQTLHLIPDMEAAVANVWRALSPGGVLLLTVPALGRHEARKGFHSDRWRVTKTGLEWLVTGLSNGRADITTYGNVLSCTAFLYGLAAEELHPEELQTFDREFPLVVAARVLKQDVR